MNCHFGVICPPFTGHLNPMLSLALEIKHKGHKVTLFHYHHTSEQFSKINQLGIRTISVCNLHTAKLIHSELQTLAELVGWKANDQTICIYEKLAKINFHNLPEKIKSARCNALLIDQSLFEGESIASSVQLPFINICNALMLNPDLNLPPLFMAWQPNFSAIGLLRNFFGYLYIGLRSGNTSKLINKYRKQNNLPSYPSTFNENYFVELWSKVAIITQQPAAFEFPRSTLTTNFHFTGPFINPKIREEIKFPWSKLNGKRLVYASIGTLQHSVSGILEKIAQACINIDCQLVITLGKKDISGNERETIIDKLPKDAVVIPYAPQLKLLEKACLCITHAGINTVLESLSNGVPMVAIPIANDQLGVGARIKWTKTGKVLKHNCTVSQLNKAIIDVLNNNSYRENALKMQREIQNSGDVTDAADIIEKAFFFSESNS